MSIKFFTKAAIFSLISLNVFAQTTTPPLKITTVRTGWNSDQVAVILNGNIPNPASCSTPDSIILNTETPGFKTHYATILSAMLNDKDVSIVVANQGCTVGRPVFWGVYVYN